MWILRPLNTFGASLRAFYESHNNFLFSEGCVCDGSNRLSDYLISDLDPVVSVSQTSTTCTISRHLFNFVVVSCACLLTSIWYTFPQPTIMARKLVQLVIQLALLLLIGAHQLSFKNDAGNCASECLDSWVGEPDQNCLTEFV